MFCSIDTEEPTTGAPARSVGGVQGTPRALTSATASSDAGHGLPCSYWMFKITHSWGQHTLTSLLCLLQHSRVLTALQV